MKQITLLLWCLLLTTTAVAQSCIDTAQIYTFLYNGKKYEIVTDQKMWDSAAACAVRRGGYLAQIGSQAENDTIYSAILHNPRVFPTYTNVPDGGGIAYIWIGATDRMNEGVWIWDGDANNVGFNFWGGQGAAGRGGGVAVAGSYVNWGRNSSGVIQEPDDYGGRQDVAAIALSSWPYGSAGQWNDINSSNTLYYVIEYDTAATNGVTTVTDDQTWAVYPDPANDKIFISASTVRQATVTIYDQTGRPVLETVYEKATPITVANLASGMYLIMVRSDRNIYRSRLLISH